MSASDFFFEHIKRNFSFDPTTCQDTLFRRLSSFTIQHEECDIMVVNGYAGTGKTSAIGAYVRTLKEFEIKFKLMANYIAVSLPIITPILIYPLNSS